MKNSKKIFIVALSATLLLTSSAIVLADEEIIRLPWMEKVDAEIDEMIQNKKSTQKLEYISEEGDGEYAYFYAQATDQEQKNAIDKLKEDRSLGIGEWKRESLKIIGQLPNDAARLTVDSALKVISQKKTDVDVIDEFNKIAGAPDWEGGSGIHRVIYYLDEQRKEAIYVVAGNVVHVTFGENGDEILKPLTGEISLKPSSTTEP